MAGLLFDSDVLGLLQQTGNDRRPGGVLGGDIQQLAQGGLLGQWQPGPNESFMAKVFGTDNPRDPRGAAMSALAQGLLRGDFPGALEGANRAIQDTEDRYQRRLANNLLLGKSALELQSLVSTGKRNQRIRDGLEKLQRDEQVGQQTPAMMVSGGEVPSGDAMGMQGIGGAAVPGMAAGPQMPQQFPTQQPTLGRANYTQGLSTRFIKQAEVYASNGDYDNANKLYEHAAKFMPNVHKIEVAMQGDQPVNVVTMTDGSQTVSPFNPAPKVHWADTGGSIVPVNELTMQPMGNLSKTMTPGERASNALGWSNNSLAQQRLAHDQRQTMQPQLVDGQWVYKPTMNNPQGATVPVSGMARPLTEFQGKSTNYAARMQDAGRVIGGLDGQEGGPPSPTQVAQAGYRAELPNWVPGGQIVSGALTAANNALNPMVTEGAQRYKQAQENWVAAALRQESGAAIGKDEMEKYVRLWFPQPGDSEAVKAQKAAARQVAERAMLTQAGPGAQQIPSILSGAQGGGGQVHWRFENGRLVKVQ
jgi:hypothetical protein